MPVQTGTPGNDVLTGSGADDLYGLQGDDTYFVDDFDRVFEAADEGYDVVYIEGSWRLTAGQHVEEMRTQDPSGHNVEQIFGNELPQIIAGDAGINQFYGGGGGDTLIGLGGGDYYYITDSRDTVIEAADGGNMDAVILQASVNYQLAAGQHVEVLDARNVSGAVSLIGNEFANNIAGNGAANFIAGGGGADLLLGGGGNDVYLVTDAAARVIEQNGLGTDIIYLTVSYVLESGTWVEVLAVDEADSTDPIAITGNEIAQIIAGNAGDNFIAGGFGADTLVGRTGNDTYLIYDSAARVWELSGEGQDTVYTTVSFALEAGISVEALFVDVPSTTNGVTLIGNELAQIISGNAGGNLIIGGGGADTLGGRGGDDTYIIDDSSAVVYELAGEGFDRVFTNVSYGIGAGYEVEALVANDAAATTPLILIGNEFAQSIGGNAGANRLVGGGGADILAGRAGNDVYVIGDSAARVFELAGEGNDTVFTTASWVLDAGYEVEAIAVDNAASTNAINLSGNEFAQILAGNAGANQLNGGAGADILQGRGGADSFVFSTALGASNVDVILDYQTGFDAIFLDDAVFTGLAQGALAAGAFRLGSTALDADDRILYDSASGALLFDADGNGSGAAVQFAWVTPGLNITASEFTAI